MQYAAIHTVKMRIGHGNILTAKRSCSTSHLGLHGQHNKKRNKGLQRPNGDKGPAGQHKKNMGLQRPGGDKGPAGQQKKQGTAKARWRQRSHGKNTTSYLGSRSIEQKLTPVGSPLLFIRHHTLTQPPLVSTAT